MVCWQVTLLFPEEGLVYDYVLDDAGISSTAEDEDDDTQRKVRHGGPPNPSSLRSYLSSAVYKSASSSLKVRWVNWMESSAPFSIDPDTSYSDIIVPTLDTVRMSHLLGMLLTNKKPVGFIIIRFY